MKLRGPASLLRRLLARHRFVGGFRGVYREFAEAQAAAPRGVALGYDNPQAAELYSELLDNPRHDDYPAIFWLHRALEPGGGRILEIGGHVGVAYYAFERLLPNNGPVAWTILDTPAVAEGGRRLARDRGRDNLRFVTDFAEVRDPVDILFASGSLQYVPGPLLPQRVSELVRLPRHILINKTPVTDGEGFVTLQDIGVSVCPYRVHSRAQLVDPFVAMGYRLVDSWRKERRLEVPGHPQRTLEHYSGFYLELPAAPELRAGDAPARA